jgi:predicted nucleic acid-binding protein
MRIADTSFLYSLFSETDEHHTKAVAEAGKTRALSIPPEILSETISLIHRRQGFQAAMLAGEWIRSQAGIEICAAPRPIIENTWKIFAAGNGRLSYPDSAVIAQCRALNARPLTFDETILDFMGRRPKT